jgi:D-alanyl-D-alanine carboxypeptidase
MKAMGTALVRFAAATFLSTSAMIAIDAPGSKASAPPAPPPTPDSVDLDAAVAGFVGDKPGGAVVLTVREGVTRTAAVGVANSGGEPMTVATVFRVGSISKPFVATIVLQLVDEGRVELDEPLSTYLPETPAGGDVTIRDLLRHRSGLPNYTEMSDFFRDTLTDRNREFTPDEILKYIAAIRPGEPDQLFVYSNTNYILLGQLIEHLEGTDLNTVLGDRISDPLGLDVTHFSLAGAPAIQGLAGGWYPGIVDGDPADAYDSIASGAWAAGALVSTTSELRTFLDALFGGELISESALNEMTTTEPDGYGLGLGSLDLPSGQRLYGHDGDIFGYLSFMAIEPNTGDTLIILTNNYDLHPFELAEQILANW